MNTFFACRKYFQAEFNFSRIEGFASGSSISYGLIEDLLVNLVRLVNSLVIAFAKDLRLILEA
jgi:hypothetical protein